MADLRGFDATQHEDMREFEVVPAGKYTAAIVGSELKDTKSGNGQGLNLTFQILEGDHKGRQLFTWLNIRHSSTEAVRIAQIELAAICKAVGVLTPKDSQELHDRPILISVKQEARKDNGAIQNKISGYAPRSAQSAPAPQMAAAGAPSGKAPWAR